MRFTDSRLAGFFINLPFVWLASGLILIPGGDNYMAAFCFLSSIFIIVFLKGKNILLSFVNNHFLLIVALSLIYAIFSYEYHGFSSRELKALFFSFFYLLVYPKERIDQEFIKGVLILGSISIVGFSFYQYAILGYSRIGGRLNPNVIACYISIFFIFTFLAGIFSKERSSKFFFLGLAALAFISVVFTGSRGAVGSVMMVAVALLLTMLKSIFREKKVYFFFGFFAVVILLSSSVMFLKPRIDSTLSEINHIGSGNLDTSIGMRLQLWNASKSSIFKKPIFGLGDDYEKEFAIYHRNGLISDYLSGAVDVQSHYHNQFIDKLVKGGFVGLLLLLLFVFYPFWKAMFNSADEFNRYCLMGLTLLFVFLSITEVPLNHSYILYTYIFFVVMFLSIEDSKRQKNEM